MYLPLTIGCTATQSATPAPHNELTIGNPEGVIEGTELGSRSTVVALTVETLTQLGVDGRPVPKLAESWWWDEDGRRLNVNLRAGVRFHDGTPLTADLAADILRAAVMRPSNRAMFTSLGDVTAIRAQGDRQLVFDLSQPSAFLPDDLELPITHGSSTVGTGPFRLVTDDETGIELERFPDYYLGVPKIARVVIRPFETLRTAWTSLLRGDIDMVTDVPADAVEFIRNDDVRVVSFERRYQYLVAFNSRKWPLNSKIVRRALNTAIDREALIRSVFQGRGRPSTGPLWPKHWAYDNSIASYRFDRGLASSLLNSAGLSTENRSGGAKKRFTFTCLVPENFSTIERIALEVQKQLYDVGVDMQFEVVPSKDFDSRIRKGEFEAILIDMISGPAVSRSYLFWRSSKRLQGLNVFGYENAEADRLFDVMRTSRNEIAVQSAFTRLQEVLLDDPPALFLLWNERSRAVRRDFDVVQDPVHDPADLIYTIWRWKPVEPRLALAH